MQRVIKQAVMACGLVAGLTLVAAAQPPGAPGQPMRHPGGRGMGPGGPMAALNLTQEQMDSIHKIMQAQQAKLQPQMEEMRKLHDQLGQAIFGDRDAGKAKDIAAQIENIQKTMIEAHIDAAVQVASSVLNDEQRKKVIDMHLDFPGMMGMGMGPMRHAPVR